MLLLLVLALVLVGCQTKELTAPKPGDQAKSYMIGDGERPRNAQYNIWAGQTTLAGYMNISNDANFIYVNYQFINGWKATTTHVHVCTNIADVPVNSAGNPILGDFAYVVDHLPPTTNYTEVVPIPTGLTTGDMVIIVSHCAIILEDGEGNIIQNETGFGGEEPGPTGNRWWFYMWYTLNGGGDYMYETAMVRMYDSDTDFTHRWLMKNNRPHPWFSYVKTYPGMDPQTFYFYAGQKYKCGEVEIWHEGDFLKVDLTMVNDWSLLASHLKIQLVGFQGAPAFGLFPYSSYHEPPTNQLLYSVPWNTDWDGMQLNISLHGDVRHIVIPE